MNMQKSMIAVLSCAVTVSALFTGCGSAPEETERVFRYRLASDPPSLDPAHATDTSSAAGMGIAVIFVMTMASAATWFVYNYMLLPNENNVLYLLFRNMIPGITPESFDLSYLETIAFILVIAGLVQLVEMIIEKFSPALYSSLGIFLPLIAVNCAILGGSLFMQEREYASIAEATSFGLGSGVGWFLAIVGIAAIREKIRYSNVPAPLRGLGITFIITGLMGIAFMSFMGIKL